MDARLAAATDPLTLAYLGDAVFELYVREYILQNHRLNLNDMNRYARRFVSAVSQADMYAFISEKLKPEESAILRRGRNACKSVPKSASVSQYRRATGLEALFGYLFLTGDTERIAELFADCVYICGNKNNKQQKGK